MPNDTPKPEEEPGSDAKTEQSEKLQMVFDPNTIDHLGIRLYSQLPAALNELVTNAYDADSPSVEITVPEGEITSHSEIVVKDHGNGMTREEVRTHYLIIGRDRRQDGTEGGKSPKGRKVTGRKGLGKLAAFGIAQVMELRTVKDNVVTAIRLDYGKMKAANRDYEPEGLPENGQSTTEDPGTTITLKDLKRKSDIVAKDLAVGLGKRLTLIDPGFKVIVNTVEVESASKHDKADCEEGMYWEVADLPDEVKKLMTEEITGWFGFVEASKQTERGVNVYANQKAAEVGTFFNYSGTTAQFARAYLVGEVHADFLDGEKDLIATARNGIVWEEPKALVLQGWGQATLRWLFGQWASKRRTKRETAIYDGVGFKEWLATREPRERKFAIQALSHLIDDERMDEDRARPLVEIVKASVESKAFDELVYELDHLSETAPAEMLLRLFSEWGVIESREFLRIFRGRLEAVIRLEKALYSNALEVSVMQPLLYENLWILDPGWKRFDRETTYSQLLQEFADEKFPSDDSNKRLDIFAVNSSGRMTVIEVKRANKVLERKDWEQLENYRSFLRDRSAGNTDFSSDDVSALLIVGDMNPKLARDVEERARIGIQIMTWTDLHRRARRIYEEYQTALEVAAPEFARQFNESLQKAAS